MKIAKRWLFVISALLPAAALAAVVTQGFNSKTQLAPGAVVSLDKNPEVVTPTTSENIASLVGIVASSKDSTIYSAESTDQVQVATSGAINAFVSTAGGDIKVGDKLTVGAQAGVAVKATKSGQAIGVAQASFDAKANGATKQTLTDTGGGKHDVYLGQIPVLIGIGYYTAPGGDGQGGILPSFLQAPANYVAGKTVKPYAALVALAIAILTFVIATIMLSGAVRGSMVSIGRNPLASRSIYRGLLGVLIAAAAVLIVGLTITVAVLRFV